MSEAEMLKRLKNSVIDGDEEAAKKAAADSIEAKVDPVKAVKDGLSEGMREIGEKFANFECFLPQVMLASDAMTAALAVITPHIQTERLAEVRLGKVVIGTVFGDIHDIGKTLVASMLSVSGFEVHDLGCDVPVDKFIQKAEETNADIIALSCLMTPSMYYQKDLINLLKDMKVRNKYFVIVGGGCMTPEWANKISSDAYGKYYDDAIEICKLLLTKEYSPPLKEPIIKG